MNQFSFTDPVHEHDCKWWFWDEIWTDRIGPYDTKEEAIAACKRYAKEVLGMQYMIGEHYER